MPQICSRLIQSKAAQQMTHAHVSRYNGGGGGGGWTEMEGKEFGQQSFSLPTYSFNLEEASVL
jgi:hypothetical protein